jgi:hypothetical protein
MKLVLNGLMQSENLSNHSLVMTKDVLENPSKISHYLIQHDNHSNSALPKLYVYIFVIF